jgi:hypothetical protein
MNNLRHAPGCECELPRCAALLAGDAAPDRAPALDRFETLLCMRDAAVQVSPGMARVRADGQVLILHLTPTVLNLLSTMGKLPRLRWGRKIALQPVTGERRRRTA